MNISQLILEGDQYLLVEKLLREGADPNQIDEDATPVLALAAGIGATDMLSLLVDAGAHVDAADSDGETALHRAAAISSLDSMRVLIGAGATIDIANVDGKTPLMVASAMGNLGACQVLIRAGANIKAIDVNGRGHLHWAAVRNDDPELVGFLMNAGADPDLRDNAGATPESLARLVGHLKVLREIVKNRCQRP